MALDETPSDRNFYGWVQLTARAARDMNCRVKSSPTCKNCFHANIILPSDVSRDTDAEIEKTKELAKASAWLVRPDKLIEQKLEKAPINERSDANEQSTRTQSPRYRRFFRAAEPDPQRPPSLTVAPQSTPT